MYFVEANVIIRSFHGEYFFSFFPFITFEWNKISQKPFSVVRITMESVFLWLKQFYLQWLWKASDAFGNKLQFYNILCQLLLQEQHSHWGAFFFSSSPAYISHFFAHSSPLVAQFVSLRVGCYVTFLCLAELFFMTANFCPLTCMDCGTQPVCSEPVKHVNLL